MKRLRRTRTESENLKDSQHRLQATILQKYDMIKNYLNQSVDEAVGTPGWSTKDLRLLDISFTEGSKPDKTACFRKLLAQLDLAEEFTSWETNRYQYCSLEKWPEVKKSGQRRVHQFIQTQKIGNTQKDMMKLGICHGLKVLYIAKHLGFVGISGILAFSALCVLRHNFIYLDGLVELLKSSQYKEIISLGQEKSDWLRNCQRFYSGKRISFCQFTH